VAVITLLLPPFPLLPVDVDPEVEDPEVEDPEVEDPELEDPDVEELEEEEPPLPEELGLNVFQTAGSGLKGVTQLCSRWSFHVDSHRLVPQASKNTSCPASVISKRKGPFPTPLVIGLVHLRCPLEFCMMISPSEVMLETHPLPPGLLLVLQ